MSSVDLIEIKKDFSSQSVLKGIDLRIESGEFLVLVGPSGCGKSTLLRIIAGLEKVTSGTVKIGNRIVNDDEPKERGVAMVFQNYALYPHMSVAQNLGFSLKLSKKTKQEIDLRVNEIAELLNIESLLSKKPGQLSGGQKQRVAMGRAMVRNPSVFLFDEPLSNLDAQLRVKMRAEIALLHKKLKSTVIYVTHDQVEAMTLADRIVVLNQGRIEQVGSPLEIYHHPETHFVASFMGTPSMNFLQSDQFPSPLPKGIQWVGFRPEVTHTKPSTEDSIHLGKAKVVLVERLGSQSHVHLKLKEQMILLEERSSEAPQRELEIDLFVPRSHLHFFDEAGRGVRNS